MRPVGYAAHDRETEMRTECTHSTFQHDEGIMKRIVLAALLLSPTVLMVQLLSPIGLAHAFTPTESAGFQTIPSDSIFATRIDDETLFPTHPKSEEWMMAAGTWDLNHGGVHYQATGRLEQEWSHTFGGPAYVFTNATADPYTMKFTNYGHVDDYCWPDVAYNSGCIGTWKYPIPAGASGYPPGAGENRTGRLLNVGTGLLYEIFGFDAKDDVNRIITARGGTVNYMTSNELRGSWWGTHKNELDGHERTVPRSNPGVGGIPGAPLMVTAGEANTEIKHAMYLMVSWAAGANGVDRDDPNKILWPARAAFNQNCYPDGNMYDKEAPGQTDDHHLIAGKNYACPPYGARVRLKSSVNISAIADPATRHQGYAVLLALQRYGAFILDNAATPYTRVGWSTSETRTWMIEGLGDVIVNVDGTPKTVTHCSDWINSQLETIKNVLINSDYFEFVDESGAMIDPNSAQARQQDPQDAAIPVTDSGASAPDGSSSDRDASPVDGSSSGRDASPVDGPSSGRDASPVDGPSSGRDASSVDGPSSTPEPSSELGGEDSGDASSACGCSIPGRGRGASFALYLAAALSLAFFRRAFGERRRAR
jgi:hypothetical protein